MEEKLSDFEIALIKKLSASKVITARETITFSLKMLIKIGVIIGIYLTRNSGWVFILLAILSVEVAVAPWLASKNINILANIIRKLAQTKGGQG